MNATICVVMDEYFKIIGISLQLLAGFILILEQVSHKVPQRFVEPVGGTLRKILGIMSGDARRRWQTALYIAFVGPLAVAILIAIQNTKKIGVGEIFQAVFFIAFFTLISLNLYLYSLKSLATLFSKKRSYKEIRFSESPYKIWINVILCVLSVMVLLALLYFDMHILITNRIVLAIWITVGALLIFLPAISVLLPSTIYLLFSLLLAIVHLLYRTPSWVFWVLIVVCWLSGGALLLVDAISTLP
jgi:hypothetical protein